MHCQIMRALYFIPIYLYHEQCLHKYSALLHVPVIFLKNTHSVLIMVLPLLYRIPPGAVVRPASTENIQEPSLVLFPFPHQFRT